MPQRNLYLCGYGAERSVGKRQRERSATTIRLSTAHSQDDALSFLEEEATKELSESEGWHNHVYVAKELTEDDLASIQYFLDHRFDDVEDAPTGFLM